MGDGLSEYRNALTSLFARTTGATKFGLERTEALLKALGDPQKKFPSIHVAGTNGKGSVVATLDALLRTKGLRVGRYTSPHLVDFRERFLVDGHPITEKEVGEFLSHWEKFAEEIEATFFEITTALAFKHFADCKVDVAVIETGLGGRLDSTNVLDPVAACVVSIGLDHTDMLGDTVEAIAREKAGIFKKDRPAVIGEAAGSAQQVLITTAANAGAKPVHLFDEEMSISAVRVTKTGTTFELNNRIGKIELTTPLIGEHQARNTAIAILTMTAAGDRFALPRNQWNSALANVWLPGRFQRLGGFVLDVAHNPAGATVLANTILKLNLPSPRTILLAVLGDKDWQGIMRSLAPAADRFFLTIPPGAPPGREFDPEMAHAYARAMGWDADVDADFTDAIRRAAKRCGTVVVTGSFHTVGAAMQRLQVSPYHP